MNRSMDSDSNSDMSIVQFSTWSNRQRKILDVHKKYHQDMTRYLNCLDDLGPDAPLPEWKPKKPRQSLNSLDDVRPKRAKLALAGRDLHEYFQKRLVNNGGIPVLAWNPTSLDNIRITLAAGYQILLQHQAKLLSHYLDFGKTLNQAFDYYQRMKLKGRVSSSWKIWLEKHVKIGDKYGRELREFARNFGQYKKLRRLGISFYEFKIRKEPIRLMLLEYTNYWTPE